MKYVNVKLFIGILKDFCNFLYFFCNYFVSRKSSVDSNSRLISSYNISSAASDRLKPPPSCIDFTKKKISLSSKNKTEQSLTAKLENANLNNDNKEGKDTQTLRKKIIKITLDSSSTENDKSVSPDVPKKIKLNSSTSSDASEENQKSKKIKLNSPTSPNKAASFQSSVSLINKHLGGKTDLNHKEEQTTVNNKSENTKVLCTAYYITKLFNIASAHNQT